MFPLATVCWILVLWSEDSAADPAEDRSCGEPCMAPDGPDRCSFSSMAPDRPSAGLCIPDWVERRSLPLTPPDRSWAWPCMAPDWLERRSLPLAAPDGSWAWPCMAPDSLER